MTMKRKSWQDYQKEIADDHYYYARSCIRQNFFPGSEKLFIDMLRNDLGKDLSDDPKHSSCTGIGYHSDIVPLETIMTVVARQFALMGEAGYENLVTSCITSFGVYTEILATWHEFPETEEKTRENLWKATRREFKKPASLAHTSDVVFHFREEIAARAKKRLVNAVTGEPLKVIMHLRDEAHRFGITFHRNKRSAGFVRTQLEEIEGIGTKTADLLLRRFRSVARIRRASEEELADAVGTAKARRVYAYFHDGTPAPDRPGEDDGAGESPTANGASDA